MPSASQKWGCRKTCSTPAQRIGGEVAEQDGIDDEPVPGQRHRVTGSAAGHALETLEADRRGTQKNLYRV